MILFKGNNHSQANITIVPGFCSSEPEEPCQFMNPGLYVFEFDISKLQTIDDFVNGRDNVDEYRNMIPGAIGHEGSLEVIINIPIQMHLADVMIFENIFSRLEYHTRNYVKDILLQNKAAYGFNEIDILALGMEYDI